MNTENIVTPRASARCSACKLPPEVLSALHRDRFEGRLGFEALAAKYERSDLPLSESGVRRHFARHVAEAELSSFVEEMTSQDETNLSSNSSDNATANLNPDALLESGAKTLAELINALDQEYRAAVQRGPQAADRTFAKVLKAQTLLARIAKQLQDGRIKRNEFRRTVPEIVVRCTSAAGKACVAVMRENANLVRQYVHDFLAGSMSEEDLQVRLVRVEIEWAKEVWTSLRIARTEALQAEEAQLRG